MLPKYTSPSRPLSRPFPPVPARSRITRIVILFLLTLLIALWHLKDVQSSRYYKQEALVPAPKNVDSQRLSGEVTPSAHLSTTNSTPWKVPLEAHIMSKCPDARDCIVDLIVPVMAGLPSEMVNFTLSYIGQVTDPDDGVDCKHGPSECLGNIIQLCAAHLYPDPKQYLGFAMCMIKRFELIPQRSMVQECAAEYGIDFGRLNDCASSEDGSYGVELLRDSVTRTKKAGVTLSCTVSVKRVFKG